jgi:hypothetical protein
MSFITPSRVHRINRLFGLILATVCALLQLQRLSVVADTSLPSGVVADWTFEEGLPGQPVRSVIDQSGNGHTGVVIIGSPTFVASPSGSQGNISISLPPGNTYGSGFLPADSPDFNRQSEFTLEAAFTPGSSNPGPYDRYLVGCFNPTSGQPVIGLGYRGDTSSAIFGTLTSPVPLDGRSHHVAAVYKNSVASLFVDGNLAGSTQFVTTGFPPPQSPVKASVGADYNGGFWLNGIIDRVRISGVALAPEQFFIAPLPPNAACVQVPPGAVALWPGDGNRQDIIGGNNGVRVGQNTYGAGEVGQAFVLDGQNDYIQIPASPGLDVGPGPGFTIEVWIQPTTVLPQLPIVEWNSGTAYGAHFYVSVIPPFGAGPGCLYANLVDVNAIDHWLTSAGGIVAPNQFQHVALTYDRNSGLVVLYRNGAVVAQQVLGSFIPQTSYDLLLGHRPFGFQGSPFSFAGELDEITLYNRALSIQELQNIFAAGPAGKCKDNTPPCGCP